MENIIRLKNSLRNFENTFWFLKYFQKTAKILFQYFILVTTFIFKI